MYIHRHTHAERVFESIFFFLNQTPYQPVGSCSVQSSAIINLFLFCFSKHLIGTLYCIPICWNVYAFSSTASNSQTFIRFSIGINTHAIAKRTNKKRGENTQSVTEQCMLFIVLHSTFFFSTFGRPHPRLSETEKNVICKHDTITRQQKTHKRPTKIKYKTTNTHAQTFNGVLFHANAVAVSV